MGKYDRVYEMLDVVEKWPLQFDFGDCEQCVIGIACQAGFLRNPADAPFLRPSIAKQLGITTTQVKDIYFGYEFINKAHLRKDKSYCLNYCRSLIETWKAIDIAQARDSFTHDQMVSEDA